MKTLNHILSFVFFLTTSIAFSQHELEIDGTGRIFGDLQLSTTTPTLYLGSSPTDIGGIGYYDNTGPFLLPEAYLSYHSSTNQFTFSDGDNTVEHSVFSIDLDNPEIGVSQDGLMTIGPKNQNHLTLDRNGIQAKGNLPSINQTLFLNVGGGNIILTDFHGVLPGNVGIGTSVPGNSIHVKQTAEIDGIRIEHDDDSDYWTTYVDNLDDYNFSYNGTLRAYIEDGAGSFVITSDGRLKNSISSLENVLERLMKLNPASYFYNVDENPDRKSWGFIAQEVEEIFPELVREKDGYKGLSYDDFGIMAIKAIQEQQETIDQQASLIIKMEQRLTALENK